MGTILYLYNSTQTYTDTVFQHIASFRKHSRHITHYTHHDLSSELEVDLSAYDAVCIHYSIRLPFDQLSASAVAALRRFDKLKVLFIQDEYDHTQRAWHWIRALGIKLVFTVVPEKSIREVYPVDQVPGVRFCSVLTGYVPERIDLQGAIRPPSERELLVGYRGRPLPVRYGQLGFEKVEIGRMVRAYCESHGFACDIAWTEEARIYGTKWLEFVASCRSMLGSESGSNVFDFSGSLVNRLRELKLYYPKMSDDLVYRDVIKPAEREGLMNQISPRAFEAIALRTVLVLFEGQYSGILQPGVHYISLKKDGSNLREVFEQLLDSSHVDTMAERAFRDIIDTGDYSYGAFVATVDKEIGHLLGDSDKDRSSKASTTPWNYRVTLEPIRAAPPLEARHSRRAKMLRLLQKLPEPVRRVCRFARAKLLYGN